MADPKTTPEGPDNAQVARTVVMVASLAIVLSCGLVWFGDRSYGTVLHSTLLLTYLAAFLQASLMFSPKFSLGRLGSVILLSTVFAPLAINVLSPGVLAGLALWLANVAYLPLLLGRQDEYAGLSFLVGLVGSLMFGMHVLVFAAIP